LITGEKPTNDRDRKQESNSDAASGTSFIIFKCFCEISKIFVISFLLNKPTKSFKTTSACRKNTDVILQIYVHGDQTPLKGEVKNMFTWKSDPLSAYSMTRVIVFPMLKPKIVKRLGWWPSLGQQK
jgi:hypothetical protein